MGKSVAAQQWDMCVLHGANYRQQQAVAQARLGYVTKRAGANEGRCFSKTCGIGELDVSGPSFGPIELGKKSGAESGPWAFRRVFRFFLAALGAEVAWISGETIREYVNFVVGAICPIPSRGD